MSRSPRKLLHRSLDALDELFAVCERYQNARDDLSVALGDPDLVRLRQLRDLLANAAARADSDRSGTSEAAEGEAAHSDGTKSS